MIKIKRGLDIPISGAPEQSIQQARAVRQVAVIGFDYVGMKPTMNVQEGDSVKLGQELFADKKTPGVIFTAPGSGKVVAVNRGEKRALQSVVIELSGNDEDAVTFETGGPEQLSREQIRDVLVKSGQWVAFRTRPFSKVPPVDAVPKAIFVPTMDSNPLAADPSVYLNEAGQDFVKGLDYIAKLTDGRVYVCKRPGSDIPPSTNSHVRIEEFDGPHPAGIVGTHIHFLEPASMEHVVWTIDPQDVIAFAKLFQTGRIHTDRVISLAGPQVEKPRLLRTRLGACTDELVAGEVKAGENRVLSGSVLNGRKAHGPYAYLGRYHSQVSVLREGRERGIFEDLWLGRDKHSVKNIYVSKFNPGKLFDFTTSQNGSPRAMVPIGAYEAIMPLDILPTQLLRAIIVGDTEVAQQLGALELDEEDLALCTYVCPGKYEYGPILRDNLTRIEHEG